MTAFLFVLALGAVVPNDTLTPGVVNPKVTKAVACGTAWGHDRRHVDERMKQAVADAYGLKRTQITSATQSGCCEVDHRIPRELGGADDVKNLWPQQWTAAHQKDELENALHRAVCAGSVTLEAAQAVFRGDWRVGYQRYVVGKP